MAGDLGARSCCKAQHNGNGMLQYSALTFSEYIKKVKRERVYIHNIDLLLMPEISFNWHIYLLLQQDRPFSCTVHLATRRSQF